MEGNIFINEGIDFAIRNYLNFKDDPKDEVFSSFLVIVIRALILIYGELDIVNPFRTNNENGWDTNLKKFGFTDEKLEKFKHQVLLFYQNQEDDTMCQEIFLDIQKALVDMFILRKRHVLVSDEDLEKFKSLLYTRYDVNPSKFVLYTKYTPNSDVILHYLNNKLFQLKHNYVFTEYKDVALSAEAYQLAGYNVTEVLNMKEEEILNINNKVYHFFRIKDNDLNKKGRLESAIQYYKKYGSTITSGNGYVDLLLILGIVSTGLMLLILIGIKYMG